MIKLVLARDKQFLIGKHEGVHGMPWHNLEELSFFKKLTMGHAVIMGRKTFDLLRAPLSGRKNIVLSRSSHEIEGVLCIQSIDSLLEHYYQSQDILYVIGGKEIYELLFPYCDELIVSVIKGTYQGDVYYYYDTSEFICVKIEYMDSFDVYYYRRRNT